MQLILAWQLERIYCACVGATQKISCYCYDCNADLKLVSVK